MIFSSIYTVRRWLATQTKSISFCGALVLSTAAVLSSSVPTHASENIVVTYGAFSRTVPISEFETLAKTGKAPGILGELLGLANESPAQARDILTYNLKVDAVTVDGLLNTGPGKFMLAELSKVVHTPGDAGNVPALRSALVLASRDDSLSLLKVFQNYPTPELYINGVQLKHDIKEGKSLFGSVRNYLDHMQCNCGSAPVTAGPQVQVSK